MIERVLEAAADRVQAADALWRRVERTVVTFEAGRLKAAGASEEGGVNLRVVRDGRVGVAGTTAPDDVASIVERAVASAELGEPLPLAFPGRASVPAVVPYDDRAASVSLDELTALGREVVDRLAREGCQVNVGVQRSVGETAVGNTEGACGSYRDSAVSLSADLVRIAGDDVLMVGDFYAASAFPGRDDVDALVHSIETRLALALALAPPPEGALPVVFTPAGLSAVLLPLEQALSGKQVLQGSSPLSDKVGRRVLDERFSLTDDPLVPVRPGSRPFDDEGVPSRPLALVEHGVVRRFIYDLETAARARAESTGHGHRGIFGKPHAGYTNLVVGTVQVATDPRLGGGLLEGMSDGLLVDDLIGVGQGNVIGGVFSHPVALAYRVRRGEIVGRVKDAAVAGNAYQLLKRIGGFGGDGRWLGSRWSPSLLLEGVAVARR